MRPFLEAFFGAKGPRLILDYLKVLAWPLVALVVLLVFSAQIKGFLGRINFLNVSPTGVTASATGTGNPSPSPSASPAQAPPPDVWYTIVTRPPAPACEDRANLALTRSEFPKPIKAGANIYGYLNQKIVGAVWCGAPNNTVLITVAGGPVTELQAKIKDLEAAFVNAGS